MRRAASDYAYFDTPFIALAHRGGVTAAAPESVENSLRGFKAAWEAGFRYLETDVHATADGTLVAFHDAVLDRVTDARGRIGDLPWSTVQRARIGGSEPIPLLADLLTELPDARFNIDIKAPAALAPLLRTLADLDAADRVCVGSFHTPTIRAFRERTDGAIATAASPTEVAVFAFGVGVRRWWPLGAQAFQIPVRDERTGLRVLSPAMIAAAHRAGAVVHVWTINDRTEAERLLDLGVDGIVSDDLAMLRAALAERDLWEGTR